MYDYTMRFHCVFQLIGAVTGHLQACFCIKEFRLEKLMNNFIVL